MSAAQNCNLFVFSPARQTLWGPHKEASESSRPHGECKIQSEKRKQFDFSDSGASLGSFGWPKVATFSPPAPIVFVQTGEPFLCAPLIKCRTQREPVRQAINRRARPESILGAVLLSQQELKRAVKREPFGRP